MAEKTSNYLQVEKKFLSDSMNSPLLSKEQEQISYQIMER